ncbi:MAG TPA: hypothetical protein VHY08_15820 [Bacillota bacterium]|nr:hypothetical protein [Bacillota bacterium]
MGKIFLNKEEAELLDSYEAGEWRSIEGWEAEAAKYKEYAYATFEKDRRINIRISSKDLEGIQKRALEEGIPYQTLIASIIHKYVSGRLVDSQPRFGAKGFINSDGEINNNYSTIGNRGSYTGASRVSEDQTEPTPEEKK